MGPDAHLIPDRTGGRIGRRGRQSDRERGAGARAGGDRDLSAVSDDDAAHQRESETVTVDLPLDRVGAAVERLEDVRQVGWRNARTVVADGDPDFVAAPFAYPLCADAYPAVPPTVFDRIGHKVLDG